MRSETQHKSRRQPQIILCCVKELGPYVVNLETHRDKPDQAKIQSPTQRRRERSIRGSREVAPIVYMRHPDHPLDEGGQFSNGSRDPRPKQDFPLMSGDVHPDRTIRRWINKALRPVVAGEIRHDPYVRKYLAFERRLPPIQIRTAKPR